jgi:hypothetical protein
MFILKAIEVMTYCMLNDNFVRGVHKSSKNLGVTPQI